MVAALLGCFLVGAGGCARWETSFRRQHGEQELRGPAQAATGRQPMPPATAAAAGTLPGGPARPPEAEPKPWQEAELEQAFQRLQAARAVMPRRPLIVAGENAATPPPPRIASPFPQPREALQRSLK